MLKGIGDSTHGGLAGKVAEERKLGGWGWGVIGRRTMPELQAPGFQGEFLRNFVL